MQKYRAMNKQNLLFIFVTLLFLLAGCKKEECFKCTAMKGTNYYYTKNGDTVLVTYLGLQQPPSSNLLSDGYELKYQYFTIPVNVEYCKPKVDRFEYYTDCVQTK